MALKRFCAVLFLIFLCNTVEGASILALFSSLSFADHLVYRGFVSLLTQRGYSVVLMTPYPGNFQYPDIERIVELDVGQESAPFWNEYTRLLTNVNDYYPKTRAINELSIKIAIAQLRSKQMTALFINPNIKFDLVITEADVPVFYAVAEKYKAPHIAITTSSGKIHQHESKGNPVHPILYPDVNTLNYGNLSFWQKLTEFNRHIQTKYEYYNNYLPLSQVTAEKILGLKRDLQEVEYDIDALFIAANPLLAGNRPTVPTVTYVDRLHIRPGFTLPENLKTILDSATKGVVYFSLGAIQESEQLPQQTLKVLSNAFRELPFTVLWKIGNTTVIDKPDNVVAQAWFPQQEVLAHPNVKAFLTHGGPRSLEEAVFYEVPIIGFPLVKPRKVFINQITKFGAGEILDPYNLDKDTVKATISVVATNEKYQKAISYAKQVTQDAVISGPENAVWWTEYVIRNGGAKYLRAPSVGHSTFQYFLLDIISIVIAGVIVITCIIFVILRVITKSIRARISGRRDKAGRKFKAL